ncbi:MAG: type II/IV secretion system ATPase subunit, partial [Candidatus Aenigmarchaeota archaeon]|nr:type II/IV secretion system ATPase subunit [Candidatus Aenigmarchaeota archaeon]
SLTLAEPLMDGALPGGSRVQVTLGVVDIARRGSNFTIRKFTERPMTPVDLIKLSTIDADTLAYLWLVIESNMSVLISGATATGKTTF